MGDGAKYQIPLFDERMKFLVWRSTVEDLLVQRRIDDALERTERMNEGMRVAMKKKAVSTIRLAIAPK